MAFVTDGRQRTQVANISDISMEMYGVRYVKSSLLPKELDLKSMENIADVVAIESDLNLAAHHVKKLMKHYLQ